MTEKRKLIYVFNDVIPIRGMRGRVVRLDTNDSHGRAIESLLANAPEGYGIVRFVREARQLAPRPLTKEEAEALIAAVGMQLTDKEKTHAQE